MSYKINMASEEIYSYLQNLPILVGENIASYLNGFDLINLGLTCKFWHEIATNNTVWKIICEKRFGKLTCAKTENGNFKKVYFHLGRTKLPVVDFYEIVHLGDRYLKKMADPESSSGSVIYLKTVCWLQVSGKFPAVFPGKYRVLWRIKLENAYMHNDGEACVYYKATPGEGCGVQLSSKWDEEKLRKEEDQHGTNKWFVYNSGELTIESMCDVHAEIHGRNGYWCGGFYWDYVQLESVNDLESVPTKLKKNIHRRKGALKSVC